MKKLSKLILATVISIALINISGCSKDPNAIIGGSTDLEFTEVGYRTVLSTTLNGQSFGSFDAYVQSNDDGNVVYTVTVPLAGRSDSAVLAAVIASEYPEYIDADGNITATFPMRITSDGYQDMAREDGSAWTMCKYGDGVGTVYESTDELGNLRTRTITHKSTDDDFSWGFWNIKVSKVEQVYPDEPNQLIKQINYWFNHKFGWVAVEIEITGGNVFYVTLI